MRIGNLRRTVGVIGSSTGGSVVVKAEFIDSIVSPRRLRSPRNPRCGEGGIVRVGA